MKNSKNKTNSNKVSAALKVAKPTTKKVTPPKPKAKAKAAKVVSDRVFLDIVKDFSTPVYKMEKGGKLSGPLTRTFRKGGTVEARKLGETKGNLHVSLKGNYLAFNVPTKSVFIQR